MRYLAIDYGIKRLGLAHCDGGETIVSPLCQLDNTPNRPSEVIEKIKQIVQEQQFEAIVMGLPLNMDGSESSQAKITRSFAEKLAKAVGVPLHFQDERLSSSAADEMLDEVEMTSKRRKERRDMLAAYEILRDFLGQ